MAILDLQGMQAPAQTRAGRGSGKSGSSKGCNNVGGGGGPSHLSLLLC